MEIGVKYKAQRVVELLAFLNREAELLNSEHQLDEYLTPPHREFAALAEASEWLRLRTRDDGVHSLTYQLCPARRGEAGPETEFTSMVDAPGRVRQILLALQFRSLGIVDKRRMTWRQWDYEISVDQVSGLGDYVEVVWAGDERVHSTIWVPQVLEWFAKLDCGALQRDFPPYFHLLTPSP